MNGDLVIRVGWMKSRSIIVLRDYPDRFARIDAAMLKVINNHLDAQPGAVSERGRDFDYIEVMGFDRGPEFGATR